MKKWTIPNLTLNTWRVVISATAFALIGTALIALSNAQSPVGNSDEILIATDKTAGYKETTPVSEVFTRNTPPSFTFSYDPSWKLYQYTDPDEPTLDFEQLRLTAPGTTIEGKNHAGDEQVKSGSVIEVSAAPNAQYKNVDEYLNQLGNYVSFRKNTTLSGLPAVEYRLSSHLEEESSTKHIVTAFSKGIQYTVSLNNIDPKHDALQNPIFQQIISTFKVLQ